MTDCLADLSSDVFLVTAMNTQLYVIACEHTVVCHCRESIYRLLPQTTPENVSKNFSQYSIDPVTRYPNININFLRPSQVRAVL